ncbi:hypothetical protein [Paenibacillus sp. FSL K6-1230]|uniref:hypothetical protein n=1 Tax=Paenibacillus sp. FSL K6-1230 TaxID=2921603 RepID=UPI0030FBCF7C
MMADPDSITISKDQASIFMVVYLGQGNEAIYRYALQDAKDDELFIRAEEILQYSLLNNGDIMLMGRVDGTRGLFLYDSSNNELHVTYLRNDTLQSDTIIYRNVQDFYQLTWLEDSLFVAGSTRDTSEIYRFTFKVW